jgi:hypothetical protein
MVAETVRSPGVGTTGATVKALKRLRRENAEMRRAT